MNFSSLANIVRLPCFPSTLKRFIFSRVSYPFKSTRCDPCFMYSFLLVTILLDVVCLSFLRLFPPALVNTRSWLTFFFLLNALNVFSFNCELSIASVPDKYVIQASSYESLSSILGSKL